MATIAHAVKYPETVPVADVQAIIATVTRVETHTTAELIHSGWCVQGYIQSLVGGDTGVNVVGAAPGMVDDPTVRHTIVRIGDEKAVEILKSLLPPQPGVSQALPPFAVPMLKLALSWLAEYLAKRLTESAA